MAALPPSGHKLSVPQTSSVSAVRRYKNVHLSQQNSRHNLSIKAHVLAINIKMHENMHLVSLYLYDLLTDTKRSCLFWRLVICRNFYFINFTTVFVAILWQCWDNALTYFISAKALRANTLKWIVVCGFDQVELSSNQIQQLYLN